MIREDFHMVITIVNHPIGHERRCCELTEEEFDEIMDIVKEKVEICP